MLLYVAQNFRPEVHALIGFSLTTARLISHGIAEAHIRRWPMESVSEGAGVSRDIRQAIIIWPSVLIEFTSLLTLEVLLPQLCFGRVARHDAVPEVANDVDLLSHPRNARDGL